MTQTNLILASTATVAFLLGVPLGADASPVSEKNKRPNILFIMSDDHAMNAVSAYGSALSRVFKTPNIDRIASEGVRLQNCLVTNSICSPSRAVILTGKYSHINGQTINYIKFDGSQQTVPKLLQGAGYQTAIVGKWHLRGAPTGFDYWNILKGQGKYNNPEFMEMSLTPKAREGYATNLITDITLEWLEQKRDKNKPFFLMCHHKAPHGQWEMDPADEGMFDDLKIPEPETLYDDGENRSKIVQRRNNLLHPRLSQLMEKTRSFDTSDIKSREDGIAKVYQYYLKNYLGCVYSIDKNVGRILAYLEKEGILDDTIIIYTSDNGMFLGEHSWYDKRMMFEESLKIPFVVRYPREIKPGIISDICLNLDFAETFLDYAKVPVPGDMQGRSFRPILRGEKPADWRSSMLYAYYEGPAQYGVRTDNYKLIFYTNGERDMFDLKKDPLEMKSVYNDPVYAEIRASLQKELERLRRQHDLKDEDLPGNWNASNPDLLSAAKDKAGYL